MTNLDNIVFENTGDYKKCVSELLSISTAYTRMWKNVTDLIMGGGEIVSVISQFNDLLTIMRDSQSQVWLAHVDAITNCYKDNGLYRNDYPACHLDVPGTSGVSLLMHRAEHAMTGDIEVGSLIAVISALTRIDAESTNLIAVVSGYLAAELPQLAKWAIWASAIMWQPFTVSGDQHRGHLVVENELYRKLSVYVSVLTLASRTQQNLCLDQYGQVAFTTGVAKTNIIDMICDASTPQMWYSKRFVYAACVIINIQREDAAVVTSMIDNNWTQVWHQKIMLESRPVIARGHFDFRSIILHQWRSYGVTDTALEIFEHKEVTGVVAIKKLYKNLTQLDTEVYVDDATVAISGGKMEWLDSAIQKDIYNAALQIALLILDPHETSIFSIKDHVDYVISNSDRADNEQAEVKLAATIVLILGQRERRWFEEGIVSAARLATREDPLSLLKLAGAEMAWDVVAMSMTTLHTKVLVALLTNFIKLIHAFEKTVLMTDVSILKRSRGMSTVLVTNLGVSKAYNLSALMTDYRPVALCVVALIRAGVTGATGPYSCSIQHQRGTGIMVDRPFYTADVLDSKPIVARPASITYCGIELLEYRLVPVNRQTFGVHDVLLTGQYLSRTTTRNMRTRPIYILTVSPDRDAVDQHGHVQQLDFHKAWVTGIHKTFIGQHSRAAGNSKRQTSDYLAVSPYPATIKAGHATYAQCLAHAATLIVQRGRIYLRPWPTTLRRPRHNKRLALMLHMMITRENLSDVYDFILQLSDAYRLKYPQALATLSAAASLSCCGRACYCARKASRRHVLAQKLPIVPSNKVDINPSCDQIIKRNRIRPPKSRASHPRRSYVRTQHHKRQIDSVANRTTQLQGRYFTSTSLMSKTALAARHPNALTVSAHITRFQTPRITATVLRPLQDNWSCAWLLFPHNRCR